QLLRECVEPAQEVRCVGNVGPRSRRELERRWERIGHERCVVDLSASLVDADRNEPASCLAPEPLQIHRSRIAPSTLSFTSVISSGGGARRSTVNLDGINLRLALWISSFAPALLFRRAGACGQQDPSSSSRAGCW